jgi:hypothetical protein
MIRRSIALSIAMLLLSGCGVRAPLRPAEGQALPVKPQGAATVPTPEELLKPNTQAIPQRSDEQLRKSEERRDDKFDSPPTTR